MSTAERIRVMLSNGWIPDDIARTLGVTKKRVMHVRSRMRNPDYSRVYMSRWRECNPAADKRQRVKRLIKGIQVVRGAEAQRVQRVVGPAHWYG